MAAGRRTGISAGGYTIAGEIALAADPTEVVPWLATAELMDRWMVGVDGIVVLDDGTPLPGARIQVLTSSGRHAGWTYTAVLVEAGPARVVRRYALEELRTGGVPLAADTSGYERTVTYVLTADGTGTHLHCTAVTVIPGLDDVGAATAAKAEQQTLTRSLQRLEAEVAGRQRGLIGRFRDTGQAPAPL